MYSYQCFVCFMTFWSFKFFFEPIRIVFEKAEKNDRGNKPCVRKKQRIRSPDTILNKQFIYYILCSCFRIRLHGWNTQTILSIIHNIMDLFLPFFCVQFRLEHLENIDTYSALFLVLNPSLLIWVLFHVIFFVKIQVF